MTSDIYREVIVGTDGSATANRAVRCAAELAKVLDVPLTIATSWYRDMPDKPPPSEEAAYPASAAAMEHGWSTEVTSDAAAIARQTGVEEIRQLQPEGNAADALVRLGEERPRSLIVVGTVGLGRRAERLLGNIPHQLTHHASRDVFLSTHAPDEEQTSWDSVVLATDGSSTADEACQHGLELARSLDAKATLLTVARSEDEGQSILDETASRLGQDVELSREVAVSKDVSDALSEAAEGYDLLVIGNKGMSGPSRLLGSIANRVTHAVPTDILLVNTVR